METLESRCLLAYSAPADPRVVTSLDGGWKFARADVAGAEVVTYNDSNWSSVSVPHTWNASDGQDGSSDYYRGIGWYRRHIMPSEADGGKRFYLKLDGANLKTDLYVNRAFVGEHREKLDSKNAGDISSLPDVLKIALDDELATRTDHLLRPPAAGGFYQAGSSAHEKGIFGQDEILSSGVGDQKPLFHEPVKVEGPKREVVGSAESNKPRHTAEMFSVDRSADKSNTGGSDEREGGQSDERTNRTIRRSPDSGSEGENPQGRSASEAKGRAFLRQHFADDFTVKDAVDGWLIAAPDGTSLPIHFVPLIPALEERSFATGVIALDGRKTIQFPRGEALRVPSKIDAFIELAEPIKEELRRLYESPGH